MSGAATPWSSPSRYGRAGLAARSALQRVLRPLIVRTAEEHAALRREIALLHARLDEEQRAREHVEERLRMADAVTERLLHHDVPADARIHRRKVAGTRRVICSLAVGDGYRGLLSRSSLSFERYAERWGWDLVLSTEEHLSRGRPPSWGKIALLRSLLPDYDWLLFLDADVVVVDLDADIAEVIRDGKDLYVVEHQWSGQYTANAGVMLMRTGPWIESLLEEIWSRSEYADHPIWENAAMLDILGYSLEPCRLVDPTRWMARVELIDRRWNAIDLEPPPRPAVIHRGFFDVARRTEQVTDDLRCALGGADPGGWLLAREPVLRRALGPPH